MSRFGIGSLWITMHYHHLVGGLLLRSPALVAFLVFALSSSLASPPASWQRATAVFVGTVVSSAPSKPGFISDHHLSVVADEPFKGARGKQIFTISQPWRMQRYSRHFSVGERGLFYLRQIGPALWDASDSSRALDDAADDLLFLRALPKSASRTRVSGLVRVSEKFHLDERPVFKPGAGVLVAISGPDGTVETIANGDGVYEVYDLTPGKYSVNVVFPPGMKLYRAEPQIMTITSRPLSSGTGTTPKPIVAQNTRELTLAGLRTDFSLAPGTRLAGVLFGPGWAPMAQVPLTLESLSSSSQPGASTRTREGGSFSLDDILPGDYRLVANPRGEITPVTPFGRVYYPGVEDPATAEVLTITREQHLERHFRIPRTAPLASFKGRVTFLDGEPASQATVHFFEAPPQIANTARADDDGAFDVKVLPGSSGLLRAQRSITGTLCAEWAKYAGARGSTTIESSLVLAGQQNLSGIVLVLPLNSCKPPPGENR